MLLAYSPLFMEKGSMLVAQLLIMEAFFGVLLLFMTQALLKIMEIVQVLAEMKLVFPMMVVELFLGALVISHFYIKILNIITVPLQGILELGVQSTLILIPIKQSFGNIVIRPVRLHLNEAHKWINKFNCLFIFVLFID
nr:uncharacterized protein LOC121116807 isoform X1 [Lepeophtheirus salmonis]